MPPAVCSPAGTSFSGVLRLEARGGTTESVTQSFTANGTWQKVSVGLSAAQTNNTSFRVQVELNTANVDLDVDTVSLKRLTGRPDESMRYDCNGSMIARVQTTSSGTTSWTYTWDEFNRLIGTQQSGQNASRDVYDASGQRVLRVDPDGSKTIYLGSTELRWSPSAPTTVKVGRTYPGGTARSFDGTLRYLVTGYQGTVFAVINASSGAVSHTRYLPYGELRSGALVNDKGFLGQTHDPASALVYLNNRYLDAGLALFVSVDPVVASTREPFLYGSGNPSSFADPTGLSPWSGTDKAFNLLFGNLVHDMIQNKYMKTYTDTVSELFYRRLDTQVSGRIDVAGISYGDERLKGNILVNEIKPDLATAESAVSARMSDLNGQHLARVKLSKGDSYEGQFVAEADTREFDYKFTIFGVEIHAYRGTAGTIVYDYSASKDPPPLITQVRQRRNVESDLARGQRNVNVGSITAPDNNELKDILDTVSTTIKDTAAHIVSNPWPYVAIGAGIGIGIILGAGGSTLHQM